MTELYDIGYERYLEMTAPANEDRLPQLIQQIYAECDCIAFEGSQTEPLPFKAANYENMPEYMNYIRYMTEHRVIGGRLENDRLVLITDDGERAFGMKDKE